MQSVYQSCRVAPHQRVRILRNSYQQLSQPVVLFLKLPNPRAYMLHLVVLLGSVLDGKVQATAARILCRIQQLGPAALRKVTGLAQRELQLLLEALKLLLPLSDLVLNTS